jgi:hypothetical protein
VMMDAMMDAAKEDDKAVFEDGATMVATMENEDEVSKARIMGASSLLLMGRVEPDREVVGTIEESQAMETEASAVLRSMAAVAPKGVVVEAIEEAMEGVGEGDEGQVSHNRTLVGGLVHPPCLNSGVMPLSVSEEHAKICAELDRALEGWLPRALRDGYL